MTAPSSFRSILGEKNFARLWYGQIISSFGDRFYQFALLYVILGIEQGLDTGKDSAQVTFCGMLPGLLLAPLYGWIIDRFSRRWVMFWADVIRALLTLSFLYLWFQLHSLAAVYSVVFLMGALNGLFIPARQAALPQIVLPVQLVTANALISLIGVIANFVGVPIVSLIVSIFGGRISFIFNSLGFLVSAWCIYHIRTDLSPEHTEVRESDKVSSWRGMLAGWRALREKRELGALVLVNSAFSFISAMALITILQQVVVTVDLAPVRSMADGLGKFLSMFAPKPPVFQIKILALGMLMAAIGLGLGAGVGLCNAMKKLSRSKALPYVALALLGLTLIGFSQLSQYWPAIAGAAFMGVISAFIVIPIESRLQHDVDRARLGRVFALRNLCTTTSFLLGLAVNLNGALMANPKIGPTRLIEYIGFAAIALAMSLALANASTLRSFWSTHPSD